MLKTTCPPIRLCAGFVMIGLKACAALKTKEFIVANNCFQNMHNEKSGNQTKTLLYPAVILF